MKKLLAALRQFFARFGWFVKNKSSTSTQDANPTHMPENVNSPKKLYALVVGIDAYTFVRPLGGCVNDANAVVNYLNGPLVTDHFDVNLKTLFNADGTKDQIVDGIAKHLGQAGEGDSVFFYFSGHGVREETTIPAFQYSEVDAKIGTLVCVDSKIQANASTNTCLADKELRYLIHQLSEKGADIVTIFDCCHSGDNTRSVMESGEIEANVRQVDRRGLKARAWEGFIFHDKIDRSAFDRDSLDLLIPEGKHVQMAACRDVEKAWEFSGRGAFTSALIETLESHQGRIRYHDLYSRIKNRMRESGDKAQTPQVYVQTGNPSDRYNLFLLNEPDDQPVYASVIFNEHAKEWRINLGALHGIPVDVSNSSVDVHVFSIDKPDTTAAVALKEVYPGHAVLDLATDGLSSTKVYRAQITGLGIKPLDIFLTGDTDGVNLAKTELEKRLEEADMKYLTIVDAEENADYVLYAKDGVFFTTRPNNREPIIQGISYKDAMGQINEDKVGTAYADFVQIAKWTYLKDLEYTPSFPGTPPAGVPQFPVELKLIQLGFEDGVEKEKQRDLSKHTVSIDMTHDRDTKGPISQHTKNPMAKVRMELINHSDEELFCTLLYMSQEFGVMYQILEKDQLWLGKDQVAKSRLIRNQAYVPVSIPDFVQRNQWDGTHDYLKLIVSKTQFDAKTLAMEALPKPDASRTRSLSFDQDEAEPELPKTYWSTFTVELFSVNPFVMGPPEALAGPIV